MEGNSDDSSSSDKSSLSPRVGGGKGAWEGGVGGRGGVWVEDPLPHLVASRWSRWAGGREGKDGEGGGGGDEGGKPPWARARGPPPPPPPPPPRALAARGGGQKENSLPLGYNKTRGRPGPSPRASRRGTLRVKCSYFRDFLAASNNKIIPRTMNAEL